MARGRSWGHLAGTRPSAGKVAAFDPVLPRRAESSAAEAGAAINRVAPSVSGEQFATSKTKSSAARLAWRISS